MIRTYNRYILRSLAGPMLFVTACLTAILWLTQSLRFVDLIVNRGLPLSTFLTLTVLLLPSLLGVILPIALVVGVLFTYHKLTMESELLVLESAGLSHQQLTRPALAAAAAVCLAGYFISTLLLPLSYRQFKEMQTFIRNNYASILLQEEVFNTPIDGLTVFIKSRADNGVLRGIFVHDNRAHEKPTTMIAQEGKLVQSPSGPKFILINGERQEIDHQRGQLSILHFESYDLDISIYAKQSDPRQREAQERFINELLNPEEDTPPAQRAKLAAEAHQRLSWPLFSIALPLLALSCLLCSPFNRRGQWKKLGLAAALCIGALTVSFVLTNIITKHPTLFALPYLWALCCIAAPSLMLRYSDKGTPVPTLVGEPA